ncbi:MAG: cell division ATP-binding protein FtsE [Burkholderiaceae bacterium]
MSFPMADAPPMVVFDRVSMSYGPKLVLDQLSFSVGRGEFVLLTGPSGAGKTTVLRLIAALERPTQGAITVAGESLGRLKRRTIPHLRRSMGIVLQDLLLLSDRSVEDNVALPAIVSGLGVRDARGRARSALQRVGLDAGAAAARPLELSGGEQQRVALARAIINRPALLLVDEPTAHLDTESAARLIQLLEQFIVAGVTIVMASHSAVVPLPHHARSLQLEPVMAAAA